MKTGFSGSQRSTVWCTYDPKKPTLHLAHWDDVSEVLDQIRHEDDRDAKSRIEVVEHETESPEEALHGDEGYVHL